MFNPGLTDRSIAYFWSNMYKREDGCWVWRCRPTSGGYGNYQPKRGVNIPTHRLAWMLTHDDPGNESVLHTCDNRLCCNPAHLFLGTQQENMTDKVAKGRQAQGRGHGMSTITDVQIDKVKSLVGQGYSSPYIRKVTGVSESNIKRIRRGEHWSCKLSIESSAGYADTLSIHSGEVASV